MLKHWRQKLTLNFVLGLLVFAALVPALIFASLQVGLASRVRTEAITRDGQELTERVRILLERLLAERTALLSALSASPALETGDFRSFHSQAKAILDPASGVVAVTHQTGAILLSTAVPFGAPMPEALDIATTQRAVSSGQFEVSDLFSSPFTNRPIAALVKSIPGTQLAARITLREEWLSEQLRAAAPNGWILGITDRNGLFVARSRDAQQWVGRKGGAIALERARQSDQGWIKALSVEGSPVQVGWQKLPFGWTAWAAVDEALYSAPPREALRDLTLGASLSIIISLLLATSAARFIGMPLKRLSVAARALGAGNEPILVATNIVEMDAVGTAMADAASSRKKKDEQVQILLSEVNHRAKNMLMVVEAIAVQTAYHTPSQFLEVFSDRLRALATCQDLLVRSQWGGTDLETLVRSQLGHLSHFIGSRITLNGPPLRIRSDATQTLGMALHELATNSSKYGALSNQLGCISISWSHDHKSGMFELSWTETDGPLVTPPSKQGFGTTLLRTVPPLELGGTATLDYSVEGINWRVSCPATNALIVEIGASTG